MEIKKKELAFLLAVISILPSSSLLLIGKPWPLLHSIQSKSPSSPFPLIVRKNWCLSLEERAMDITMTFGNLISVYYPNGSPPKNPFESEFSRCFQRTTVGKWWQWRKEVDCQQEGMATLEFFILQRCSYLEDLIVIPSPVLIFGPSPLVMYYFDFGLAFLLPSFRKGEVESNWNEEILSSRTVPSFFCCCPGYDVYIHLTNRIILKQYILIL